jgi:DNA/RNA-binding domain of Phe-tRNA-synthetase-like protein
MHENDVITFQYHPDILTQFPDICGGVVIVRGLQNGSTPPALLESFVAEQQAVLTKIGETPLREIASIAAWRSAFRRFGVNPTKYRSAVEALLRRLTKKGDIPSINTLVDIGNLVSIRHHVPIAIFDVRAIQGALTVRFSKGDERFTPLFANQVENPEENEVIFVDETGLVVARRWCWRQSDESASRPDTTNVIITIESQHEGGKQDVIQAQENVLQLLSEFAGGESVSGVVGVENPSISG